MSLLTGLQRRLGAFRSMDWMLFLSVFTLMLLGFAAIYSVELSLEGVDFLNLKKQVVALVLGLVAAGVLVMSNCRLLKSYALVLYVFGLVLLGSVLLFGQDIRGAQGWFVFGPVSFQPVEVMKLSLIVALATYFSTKARRPFAFRELLHSGVLTFIPVALVMMQPDLGSASVLVGTWGIMLLFVGIPWRYIGGLVASFVALSLAGWFWLFADYQKARIMTLIDPAADPQGAGYNVTQAIIAIGSGQWFGSGLGFGTQSQLKFLPESQTDFIFAVIAEELGFVGVVLLLSAFFVLLWRLWVHASRSRDDFTTLLLVGIGAVFFFQFMVNVGMNLGLFPVTGIGLPFVSYGGSSMLLMLVLFAIAQSIIMRERLV